MASTFTGNKHLERPANGDAVGVWDIPVNADWTAIDTAFGGLATLNATAASGTVALVLAQYLPPNINITGTLTANVNYQLPANVGGFWFINNGTTGAFSIAISSATGGGSTLTVPQGGTTAARCDGTNILLQSTNLTAAGATGDIQYNSGGTLVGTGNLLTDGNSIFLGAGSLTTAFDVAVGRNLSIVGEITGPLIVAGGASTTPVAVAFSATAMVVNCVLSNVFATVFTANVTVAPAINNPLDGQTINWRITQDATGGRTMTWPASFKWAGASPGVLSTAANAVDLLVATYFASTGNWLASLGKGFA